MALLATLWPAVLVTAALLAAVAHLTSLAIAAAIYLGLGVLWAALCVPWGDRVYFALRWASPTRAPRFAAIVGTLVRFAIAVAFWPIEALAADARRREQLSDREPDEEGSPPRPAR